MTNEIEVEPKWYHLQTRSVRQNSHAECPVKYTNPLGQAIYSRVMFNRPSWFAFFVPFFFVYVSWLILTIQHDLWYLAQEGWKMSITMVFGAFVAGSTSLGGGAVAFPVMTLVLELDSEVGRDFSMMIQSIGMTAATWNIFYSRVHMDMTSFYYCTLGGIVGVIFGFLFVAGTIPSVYVTMFFVSFWLSFSASLYLTNRDPNRIPIQTLTHVTNSEKFLLFAVGMVGGIATSLTGSGVDICCFALLTTYFSLNEAVATPTSVALMGVNTVVGFLTKLALYGIEREAKEYVWFAMPVVVLMAPFGAYVASFLHRKMLALLVYCLTIIQFILAYLILDYDWMVIIFSAGVLTVGCTLWYSLALKSEPRKARVEQERIKELEMIPVQMRLPFPLGEVEKVPVTNTDVQVLREGSAEI